MNNNYNTIANFPNIRISDWRGGTNSALKKRYQLHAKHMHYMYVHTYVQTFIHKFIYLFGTLLSNYPPTHKSVGTLYVWCAVCTSIRLLQGVHDDVVAIT